jgi:hypothetical protein
MFDLSRSYYRQARATRSRIAALRLFTFFGRWKHSLRAGASPLEARMPWLTFRAVGLLGKKVGEGATVFEYGGGGSTLFFLDRGASVVTVEHDPEWFSLLNEKILGGATAGRWTGMLHEPTPAPEGSAARPADPDAYRSNDERYEGMWFRDYAAAIDTYPEAHFDLVLVDGRSRPSCLKHAAGKVRTGGLLVLDNTERGYYRSKEALSYLAGYRPLLDNPGPAPGLARFTQTTVWERSR